MTTPIIDVMAPTQSEMRPQCNPYRFASKILLFCWWQLANNVVCGITQIVPDRRCININFTNLPNKVALFSLVLCTGTRLTARTGTGNRFSVRFFDK